MSTISKRRVLRVVGLLKGLRLWQFISLLLATLSCCVVLSTRSQAALPGWIDPLGGRILAQVDSHSSEQASALLPWFGGNVAKQIESGPLLQVQISRHLQTGTLSPADYEDRPLSTPVDTVILHHTALSSRRSSVQQVADSWQNSAAEVSGHFVIGTRGEVLLAVPISKTAFHIVKQTTYLDPDTAQSVNWINQRSIGFEFHYHPHYEQPTQRQIEVGGRLMGLLFNRYPDLDVRRIFGHGIQAFSDAPGRGKVLSEPTHLFMRSNGSLHPNFITFLTAAAQVSPEIASAAQDAGGIPQLASQIRQQTLSNRDRNLRINSRWKQESQMPVSPIEPAAVEAEVQALVRSNSPQAS